IYIYIYIYIICRKGRMSGASSSDSRNPWRIGPRNDGTWKTISARRRHRRRGSPRERQLRGATNDSRSMGAAEMISTIGWIPCSPPRSVPSAATGHGRTSSSAPRRMSPRMKSDMRYC
ncbi:unnamed protein product, partial [Musa acuminata subsp. burmannicoides]